MAMVKVSVSDELIDYIITDAGTGYWQQSGKVDLAARTLVVRCEDPDEDKMMTKTLSFDDLVLALCKLADGRVQINSGIRAMAEAVLMEEDADYDADLGDCMIQVAMFGDVVFG